jgi:hypothetical protein
MKVRCNSLLSDFLLLELNVKRLPWGTDRVDWRLSSLIGYDQHTVTLQMATNCNVCQNDGTTAKRRGLYPKAKVLQKDRYVKPGPVDPMFLCEGDKWTGISRFPGSESSNQVSLLSCVYIAVTLIVS